MSTRTAVEHDAVFGGAAGEVRGVGAGDQRLGRHAAGVDAGAAEQLALDERDLHPGAGQAAGERRAGLAGADDDGVEVASCSADPMSTAPPMATASSMNAAGRSLPKPPRAARAGRVRRACRSPRRRCPPAARRRALRRRRRSPRRTSAPRTMRAPNCTGTVRLGVEGSWSVTSSTSASSVRIHGGRRAQERQAVRRRSSHPRCAAQLTAAGAVIARSPATTPIRSERRSAGVIP